MEPWLFALLTNLVLILALAAIGYGIIYSTNGKQSRLYGEYCKSDSDCKSSKNLVCQSGKCLCSSTTYFDSSSTFTGSCGKI